MRNETYLKRFLLATILPAFSGLATVGLTILYFGQYGVVLFVLLPVYIGFLSAALYGKDETRRILSTTFFALLLTGLSLMAFALEGAVCLVMAFPLALGFAFCGSFLGTLTWKVKAKSFKIAPLILLLFMPFLLSFEASQKSVPTVHRVVSTVEINAPIETVWRNVVAFPQIETPPEGILRLGFAYPINARIEGQGVGAIRYCNFNTGAFVEPITHWQEPNLLASAHAAFRLHQIAARAIPAL